MMGIILPLLGLKGWIKIVVIPLLAAIISYFIFSNILGVPLPRGIIFS
jgi:hypothetical protein